MVTRRSTLFSKAEREALKIMNGNYDPLHDAEHALETKETAIKIYKSLGKEQRAANLELIELACLYHDSSRKIIGTNLLLQPFLDEWLSGKIAYRTLRRIGYPKSTLEKVVEIISGTGDIPLKRHWTINSRIISDADKVEVYNPQRIERALRRFEEGMFPRYLLNAYVLVAIFLKYRIPKRIYFEESKKLQKEYDKQISGLLRKNSPRLKKLLYRPVFRYLLRGF